MSRRPSPYMRNRKRETLRRLVVEIDERLFARIDDFGLGRGYGSRTEAVRALLEKGLTGSEERPLQ